LSPVFRGIVVHLLFPPHTRTHLRQPQVSSHRGSFGSHRSPSGCLPSGPVSDPLVAPWYRSSTEIPAPSPQRTNSRREQLRSCPPPSAPEQTVPSGGRQCPES